jgi:hypothetical protein
MSFDFVNWDEIIIGLKNGKDITADKRKWNSDTPGYLEIYKMWEDARFNLSSIKWINYYPVTHYSESVDDQMCKQLGINKLRSWISQIDPGYCAPWHWDVDDNESTYLQLGEIQRYSCFISKPSNGQMFQLGDRYYTSQPQGTIIKWNNYKEWHAGVNAGITSKYMYHIMGYKH